MKLTNQVLQVAKRILRDQFCNTVVTKSMQFGFMPRKADSIFILIQVQDIQRDKNLYFVFADLKTAFNGVPERAL